MSSYGNDDDALRHSKVLQFSCMYNCFELVVEGEKLEGQTGNERVFVCILC